ncbi:NtaA/DmoA family FMN-dependent monooxygenase [Falsiroseomonas algicola]|nr:NtaA/DmoA family FMN-dependent monooxygenase [Falsiroseomonas algicola]
MAPRMHLALDLSMTHLDGRWRSAGSWVNSLYPDPAVFEEIARIAERGCIDMLFFGDGTGIPSTWKGSEEDAVRWGIGWPRQDMSPYIALMARATKHIGFGLTYASTFMHPFYVARLLNSLDHVTGGRIAFNVITSTRRADAANYGFDELMEHNARYERMEEFIDVCKGLWRSIDADAFQWDRESGVVADPAKVRPIHHDGRFFKVRGPLSVVPSPQIEPVLIQAGGSPRGIQASAYFAEHVFAAGPPLPQKQKHRAALDAALVKQGRDPSKVGILFSTPLIVAETESEARARKEKLLAMIPPEGVGAYLSHNIGYDFSKLPSRFKPAELNKAIAATGASPMGLLHQLVLAHGEDLEMTPEEFFQHGLRSATGYDRTFAGDARQVADYLEGEFDGSGQRGGFMVSHPQATPRDTLNLVDFLVPELQRRGRLRRRYEGQTLRDNLLA